MQIDYKKKDGLDYITISDVFSEEIHQAIQKEAKELYKFRKSKEKTKTASHKGMLLKEGTGVFLNELYYDSNDSAICTNLKEVVTSSVWENVNKIHCSFNHINCFRRASILLNWYQNGDYYKPHDDDSKLTCIYYTSLGEYSGGELKFVDYDETIKTKNNSVVIFSGCVKHEVLPVKADIESFRISINLFME
jgi:Rps23 Pro-64 3,4-dihydroxylase Tpa1-like proline 4-hydroxylase